MVPEANEAFVKLLDEDDDDDKDDDDNDGLGAINVIVADFIEMEDLISAIIDRNYRIGLKLQSASW